MALRSALLHRGTVKESEVVHCTLDLAFHSSSDLFSVTESTFLDS